MRASTPSWTPRPPRVSAFGVGLSLAAASSALIWRTNAWPVLSLATMQMHPRHHGLLYVHAVGQDRTAEAAA